MHRPFPITPSPLRAIARRRLFGRGRIGDIALLAMAGLLTACGNTAPTGQVLASVGGDDITARDLTIELNSRGATTAPAAERQEALDDIVDRALLAQVARRDRLDRTPEYLGAIRRARALALQTILENQVETGIRRPSPADIATFVASHPWMFGQRAYLEIDRIVTDARPGDQARLAASPTLDAVAQALAQSGRTFRRSTDRVDSGNLPQDMAERLTSVTDAAPRLFDVGGQTIAIALRRRDPAAVPDGQDATVAIAIMQQETLDERMANLLERERQHTVIRYQPAYAPASR